MVPEHSKVTVCEAGSLTSRTPLLQVTCDAETAAAASFRGDSHGVGQDAAGSDGDVHWDSTHMSSVNILYESDYIASARACMHGLAGTTVGFYCSLCYVMLEQQAHSQRSLRKSVHSLLILEGADASLGQQAACCLPRT
jgi:hypothetical protein